MKKITLIAAAGLIGLAANAQYTCNPSTSEVVKAGAKTVDYIVLADAAVAELQQAGAKVNYIGPDADNGRNLWYWENTFIAGDESMPRVDMEEGGYISVQIGTVGWSGAGLAVDKGIDLSSFDDETVFHLAYMTPTGNGPASIALILLDGAAQGSQPAKIALGDAFNDNGAIFPAVAPKIADDWQGLEISLGNIKKLWPSFDLQNKASWTGNLFSWLGGGVTGQTMAFDTVYFYSTKSSESGIAEIAGETADFIVTDNTVNVLGGNGIALYNLGGQLVKSTDGTVLGISNVTPGLYIAKSGSKVKKIVIR